MFFFLKTIMKFERFQHRLEMEKLSVECEMEKEILIFLYLPCFLYYFRSVKQYCKWKKIDVLRKFSGGNIMGILLTSFTCNFWCLSLISRWLEEKLVRNTRLKVLRPWLRRLNLSGFSEFSSANSKNNKETIIFYWRANRKVSQENNYYFMLQNSTANIYSRHVWIWISL